MGCEKLSNGICLNLSLNFLVTGEKGETRGRDLGYVIVVLAVKET